MRFIQILSVMVILTGCATPPAATTGAPSAALSSAAGQSAILLARAGAADAPTQQDVARTLGAADITRQDGVGVAMTYRLEHCALLLLFAADARNVMRLREAHPSARRAGEAAPSLEQCGAEVDARRS